LAFEMVKFPDVYEKVGVVAHPDKTGLDAPTEYVPALVGAV